MGKLHSFDVDDGFSLGSFSPKEMIKDYAGEGNMLQFRIVS